MSSTLSMDFCAWLKAVLANEKLESNQLMLADMVLVSLVPRPHPQKEVGSGDETRVGSGDETRYWWN